MAAPNLVEGEYRYDFGDVGEHTPLLKTYTLGHKIEMPPIKAEGLQYHGAAPLVSLLRHLGIVKAKAYPTDEKAVFEAAKIFLQSEGWLIASESSHAVRPAIDEALENGKTGEEKVICINISGHGFLDIPALPLNRHTASSAFSE